MPRSGESDSFFSTQIMTLEGKAWRRGIEERLYHSAETLRWLTDCCRGNLQTSSSACHRCPHPLYHWHEGKTISKVTKRDRCESAEKPTQTKKFNDLLILVFHSAIMIMIMTIITMVMKMQILFYPVHWTGNSLPEQTIGAAALQFHLYFTTAAVDWISW